MLVLGAPPGVPAGAAAAVLAGAGWGRLAGMEGAVGGLKVEAGAEGAAGEPAAKHASGQEQQDVQEAGAKGGAVIPAAKHASGQGQQHVRGALDHCRLRVRHARVAWHAPRRLP